MEKHILLSIIIPLYNCEKYIAQCLDSIIAQRLDKAVYEVIVIDDGSKDNGYTIVSEYAKNHDNIHVVKQENQGVACARNNAIEKASGDYITFVDADDMLVEGSLCDMLKIAIDNKADIVKGTHVEVPQEAEYKDYQKNDAKDASVECMSGEDAIVKVTKLKEGYCWGYLLSRKLIVENKLTFPPKVSFMEDWAFITQAILLCKTFVNTNILYYLYRHNDTSCVANMSTDKLLLGCQSINIVAKVAKHTNGATKRKLIDNVCTNINIVLWYTIHYNRIFCNRKAITDSLIQLLNIVESKYIPNNLKPFKFFPRLYILFRHLLASKKY